LELSRRGFIEMMYFDGEGMIRSVVLGEEG
jgi:hypothetical protein